MHVGRRGGGGGAESGSGSSHKNATNRFSQLAKSEIRFYWRQAFSRNFSDRSFLAFSNLNAPVPQAVHGCEIFNRLISSMFWLLTLTLNKTPMKSPIIYRRKKRWTSSPETPFCLVFYTNFCILYLQWIVTLLYCYLLWTGVKARSKNLLSEELLIRKHVCSLFREKVGSHAHTPAPPTARALIMPFKAMFGRGLFRLFKSIQLIMAGILDPPSLPDFRMKSVQTGP